jgi:ketosteroid isomerase-like protein
MASDTELLAHLYNRFNARDIEAALATMHPDVVWHNDLEGGYVYGHAGVRDYWTRQWEMINSHAEPVRYSAGADGMINVEARLTGRDVSTGSLVYDNLGQHVFQIENGLIRHFERTRPGD